MAVLGQGARPRLHPAAPRVRLQVPAAPVGAHPPAVLDDRVADLSGRPPPHAKRPFEHQPTTDPRAAEHAEEVPVGPPRAAFVLAADRHPNVVVQPHRDPAERLRVSGPSATRSWKPGTFGECETRARARVDLARRPHPDRRQSPGDGPRPRAPSARSRRSRDDVRRARLWREDAGRPGDLPVAKDRRLDLRPAEVDPGRHARHLTRPSRSAPRCACAAPGTATRACCAAPAAGDARRSS